MERTFTVEEKKSALEFAYSMGLKRPESRREEDIDFAHAMGLKDGAKNLSYRVTLRKHPA